MSSKYALLIDYKYCTGCHTCEVACQNEKGLSNDEWGIKVTEYGPAKLGDKWYWNYVPVPSDLCDLCAERVEAGKKPSCVKHCLAHCMELVPAAELGEAMQKYAPNVASFIPPLAMDAE